MSLCSQVSLFGLVLACRQAAHGSGALTLCPCALRQGCTDLSSSDLEENGRPLTS